MTSTRMSINASKQTTETEKTTAKEEEEEEMVKKEGMRVWEDIYICGR